MAEGEMSKTSTSETELLKELEKWKEKAEKMEKRKAEILLSKLALDEKIKMKQKALADLVDRSSRQATERMRIQKNQKLQQCLLKKKMKFVRLEDVKDEDDYQNMSCHFHLSGKIPITMNQGEALIQFEEESVAQQVIKKGNHIINLENKEVALKACTVVLEMGTTFKIHVEISSREICVSNIPNVNIAEEWMKDKLELLFCKAKLGEIQNIFYNPLLQKATITFSQPIALNKIIRYEQYLFNVLGKNQLLTVLPHKKSNVENVQMFSGTSRKTVLLKRIDAEQKDEENVEDMIEIHFQKPSNGGGEVDRVTYTPKGTKTAYFEIDKADCI